MKRYDPPISYEEWKRKQFEQKLQEKFEKDMLRVMFPTLSQIPLPWIIVAIICILFSLFTCLL